LLVQEQSFVITLKVAQIIVEHALIQARKSSFRPLSVVVLDARGAVIAVASEDGASFKRFQIAHGKAHGAPSMWLRAQVMAAERRTRRSSCSGWGWSLRGRRSDQERGKSVLGAVGVSGDIRQ
jgi:uncharacterized protein GlcG (DUF336 family)